jgi:hypothetical protein
MNTAPKKHSDGRTSESSNDHHTRNPKPTSEPTAFPRAKPVAATTKMSKVAPSPSSPGKSPPSTHRGEEDAAAPPAGPPTLQQSTLAVLDDTKFVTTMTVATVYALFADDIRLAVCPLSGTSYCTRVPAVLDLSY